MKRVLINGRWPLNLPDHRADRPEWPYWEATRLAAMHHFIEPGDVVWDIGAEEGDFAALFATWGAFVVMVEPNPKAWPNIRAIWEANEIEPLGTLALMVSDRRTGALVAADPWPEEAFGPVVSDHGFYHIGEHDDLVGSITLEQMAGVVARPHVVTMDVEGGELHVLRGAEWVLEKVKPAVFASLHPQFMADLYGEDVNQIHDLMKSYGYHGRFLCEDHEQHWYWGHPDSGRMLPGAAADYYIPGDRIVL